MSTVITVKDSRLVMAVAALIAIGGLATACGSSGEQSPSSTTTTTTTSPSSAAAPTPTEKGVSPTGGNLFTPGVTASPAPNVPPGQHPGINGTP
ncbi:MAG TPA: hypothetical protein VJR50_05150 [Mycobacterium sp.]|jgi:hypothetical protein|nr:hypothetical protein [Mycobacterium sp.]